MDIRRALVLVIDSIGVGHAPDAEKYHSNGADTLGHVASWFMEHEGRALQIPHLVQLGITKTHPGGLAGIDEPTSPLAAHGRMQITSFGNDSLDGHWEMMCLPARFEVDYFPKGFPDDLLDNIRAFSGRGILCNQPYSGTEVIHDYGEEHLRSGDLIVYTSGDSVIQIAAHEDVVPLDELYRICTYVRTLINGPEITMGRVIARPFVGASADTFMRTSHRHDYGLEPYGPTVVDMVHNAGLHTIAVGKTYDLLCGHGFDEAFHNENNHNGMEHVIDVMSRRDWEGLCFTNLVDFDAVYGHRRDPYGDGLALEDFDAQLGDVCTLMDEHDLLIITADHGNDPTYQGTDHTRELVPLLAWSPAMQAPGANLGTRATASDVGATVLEALELTDAGEGTSFLSALR
ncbi:phosphopentomutase [Collinsella sp. zg1085]|uniref:phosphopentomutase n=1 Tax=Collinsella sp. zg1085 TaxID=2844380 RepID=UPI001C0CFDDA|nr:phosphopentomutase [Collinsella sp. zg1085]QWT17403.1 phosphopentomutase [Collinsella sp. zg1085]